MSYLPHSKLNTDAFGRLRVSNPSSLLEISHVIDKDDIAESEIITGGATSVLTTNTTYITLAVSTTGDDVKRRSRDRGIYEPGKSQLVYMSGVLNVGNNNATGVVSKIGNYDETSGIYFKHIGDGGAGSIAVVIRTSTTGSVTETTVLQSAFNKDKVDGAGSSGITADWSQTQIFMIDFEWLGVGRVRLNLVIDGEIVPLHYFRHANNALVPYMTRPSLPLCYEIGSTVASAAGSMLFNCGTIMSEGGHLPVGRQFSISNGITSVAVGTTTEPIICLRLKSTHLNTIAQIAHLSLTAIDNVNFAFYIYIFRDVADTTFLTGQSWVSADIDSSVEYDVSATAITLTNGHLMGNGHITGDNNIELHDKQSNNLHLTSNISDVPDIICLCAQSFSGNRDVVGGISWDEYA